MITSIALGTNALYAFRLAEGGALLVDAGPDLEGSWDELVAQLRAAGVAPREVRIVLVTHAHADHAGLTARWAAEGARVLAGGADLDALRAGAEGYAATRAAREAELRRHGCPAGVLEAIAARPRGAFRWPGCADVEAAVHGTSFALAGGGQLRVLVTPGHTPGNVVIAVERTGAALELCSGDTLLPDTIPTPGLHFPRGPDGPRWPSLPPFVDSVAGLHALALERVWPGHGATVEGHAARGLSARFLAHHERRASRVRAALDAGPASAFEVARTLFPRLPAVRLGQALTEVIGHFDLLVASGGGILEEGVDGVLGMRAVPENA